MAKNFAQCKGQRAERQVIQLLQPVVNEVYEAAGKEPPELMRNLMQSNKGGFDIAGLEWLALEVKHQETLHLNAWWLQCVEQGNGKREPILFYKQNNVKWQIMMFGRLVPGGSTNVRAPCIISIESFMLYFKYRLEHEVMK